VSAGQAVGPLDREGRSLIQPPLPPDEAARALAAAAGVSAVGLRPSFVTPAAAHSHPDCRAFLTLIVAPQALDPELVGEVLDTMRKLKSAGMTMVVVTHDIAFARETGDRVAFFDRGTICEVGQSRQVINEPREERTRQFLQRVLN
jgi:hypothetical protein